ncbi:MAG: hypothetical protein DM484_01785 [Candidatus Methylumidiphilus alinenensis]|uniref:Uncharacterized protein n=1 Tax=Candidatus Methylumidiphilus alinenensis TaxID=2202197 RepID=A0A2W4TCW8_9GAMM|nr:MAG: hypothetical protein DM484_01785 [Candidatus Methylumidiphilus alinenensis]
MRFFARYQAPYLAVINKSSQADKSRHFGRDAEIQAMDGSQPVVQVLDSGHLPTRCFMFVDAGTPVVAPCCHPWMLDFGVPAEMTGLQHLCKR